MSQLERRIKALEKVTVSNEHKIEVLCLCAPGGDGPELAWIMDGPNCGKQIMRSDGESASGFKARIDHLLAGSQVGEGVRGESVETSA